MKSELHKKRFVDFGSNGLPKSYPVPPADKDLLFYIQRNQNTDTIVYQLNRNSDGLINKNLPMHAYWVRYAENGAKEELNAIQNQLAFGYNSEWISPELIKFSFVSYEDLILYITRDEKDKYRVITTFDNEKVILQNIYVYAHEFGVFPDVRFIELYGQSLAKNIPVRLKITME